MLVSEEVMATQVGANLGILELLKNHLTQSLYFADEAAEAQSENYIIFGLEGIVEVIQSDLSISASYNLGISLPAFLIAGHPGDCPANS